jgi:cell division protein ZapA
MSKTSIKVVLAGRNYPLTVNEGEQEIVQKAVNGINSSIKRLQENYAVKDMQDLLAMTALQLATRSKEQSPNREKAMPQFDEEALVKALQEISSALDK